MKFYDYLFYKIYQLLEAFVDSASFATIIVMSWMFLFNTFTLVDFIIQSKELSAFFSETTTLIYSSLIILTHFGYFYYNGRHFKILAKYKNEGKRNSYLGFIYAGLYLFLSIWTFFIFTVPVMGGILKL